MVDDDAAPPIDAPLSGVVMVNICALLLLLLGTFLIGPLGEKSRTYASSLYDGSPRPIINMRADLPAVRLGETLAQRNP